jgi:hypothetical protein
MTMPIQGLRRHRPEDRGCIYIRAWVSASNT